METAKRLRQFDDSVSIIFVTNLANFAIKGYEVNALDFLVKPVGYTDFACRIDKFVGKFNTKKQGEIVICGANVIRIKISDIKYIEVAGSHNICYHLVNGKEITIRESLIKAEKQLPSNVFSKCNSGCLVNLQYVSKIENNMAKVGEEWFSISRLKEKDFKNALLRFLNE